MKKQGKKYLLTTPRLGLRTWLPSDLVPFAEINANEEVMRFFPKKLNREKSAQLMEKYRTQMEKYGHCYFATDRLDTGEFIGFIGLAHQNYEAPFCPCTDIGWRLHPSAWGNGFATEGAKACLEFAFEKLGKKEIYAVAPSVNLPSIRVMKKIGMTFEGTFEHPRLLGNERLRNCMIYKIELKVWKQRT